MILEYKEGSYNSLLCLCWKVKSCRIDNCLRKLDSLNFIIRLQNQLIAREGEVGHFSPRRLCSKYDLLVEKPKYLSLGVAHHDTFVFSRPNPTLVIYLDSVRNTLTSETYKMFVG